MVETNKRMRLGMMYAVTDSEGKCVLFGVGQPTKPYALTKTWQRGQQFWTDFLPVRYDEHWNFIDEQTQVIMDPRILVTQYLFSDNYY
jgi:hypothetical protein